MQCKPTILGVADARHYLVGATDNDNNFIALPCLHTVAMCNSLPLAKQLLRDNDINVVDGIQYWTVPYTGTYNIELMGARGGEADCYNYGYYG